MTDTALPSPAHVLAPASADARPSRRVERVAERGQALVDRLETWAHRGPVRSLLVKALVTVLGPIVILTGIAMTVLPGPGLVVVALGLALLALEYAWARTALRLMGRALSTARAAALPEGASRLRRGAGAVGAGAFVVATFALTTAITTYLGAHALL
jgi:uncharacterized protein (TIGR02611 family)